MAKRLNPIDMEKLHENLNGSKDLGAAINNTRDWCSLFICCLLINEDFINYCRGVADQAHTICLNLEQKNPIIRQLYYDFNSLYLDLIREDAKVHEADIAFSNKSHKLCHLFFFDNGIFESTKVTTDIDATSFECYEFDNIKREPLDADYIALKLPILKDKSKVLELARLYIDYYYEAVLISQDEKHSELKNIVPSFVPVSSQKYNIYVPLENEKKLEYMKKCIDIFILHRDATELKQGSVWKVVEHWLKLHLVSSYVPDENMPATNNVHLIGDWVKSDLPTTSSYIERFNNYRKMGASLVNNALSDRFPY